MNPSDEEFRTLQPGAGAADDPQTRGAASSGGETQQMGGPSLPPTRPVDRTIASTIPEDDTGLKRQLLQLDLIIEADWQAAMRAGPPTAELHELLRRLQQVPASGHPTGKEFFPALTAYQVQQILSGNAADLRIHHYIVRESLGRGGMGEVVKAWNPVLCRHEAIKKVLVTATKSRLPAKTGVTLLAMQRFEQEARVLAQLNQPSITTIYHAGFEGDVAFIAMEYVKGKTLRTIVQEAEAARKPLPVGWVVRQIVSTSRALQHAHEREVIHRDIKPGNIMITDDGSLKVLDMGIARLLSGDGGGEGAPLTQQAALGTPEVMPPEQWADAHSVTPASDIYSLGCTFFYLLAGRMPFPHSNPKALMIAHLNDPPPDICQIRKDVPPALAAVVAKMLAKEAEHRYKTCSELIAALEPFSDQTTAAAKRPAWVYLAPALVAAALVVAAVLLLRPPPPPPPAVFSEQDFTAWLTEHQQSNAAWPDLASAKQFAADLPADLDWFEKRNRLAAESQRRGTLQDQARYWLKQHQEANSQVWESLSALEKFAGGMGGFAQLFDQNAVERFKTQVTTETARLWSAAGRREIEKLQADYPDVWPTLRDVEAAAEAVMPLSEVASDAQLRSLRSALNDQAWRRRRERWLDQQLTQFAFVWPRKDELVQFADQTGLQVRDSTALDKLKTAVEKETRARVRTLAARWLAELSPETATLEKDLAQVLAAARTLADPAKASIDDAAYQQLLGGTRAVTADAAAVLGRQDVRLGNDPVVNHHASVFLTVCRWLAGTLAQPNLRRDDVVQVRTVVDGKPAQKVPLKKEFSLVATARQGGYLTVVVFGNDGEQLLFLRPQAVRAGEEVYLLRDVPAKTVGTDRIVVFLTSADPLVEVPPPPAGVAPPEVIDGNQFYELKADQLDQVQKLFKFPSTFERIGRHLWAGTAPLFVPPNPKISFWGHKNFELSVVP